ncbi:hypothetical protein F2Q68_00045164 [Brassica cretica]|uniref:Uncharacterized protein n=1 Tax=Brassica cretica TaxID=69181 RepID=A0A8S9LIY1_BRACR|nr:hypothetical protein F2Q68_00045164 [Brassica cretica]
MIAIYDQGGGREEGERSWHRRRLSLFLSLVSRCGGHGACGEEATEKLVVGAEWWSWGLQREGDREVGGREKKLWSWGLRRGMEKFVRRLAQEY